MLRCMEHESPNTGPAREHRIGRYLIVRPLSKGGMALVYEGRRIALEGVQPKVAVKIILPEHEKIETFKELFIKEAHLGAAMQHQNLVQIQDFDRDGDRFFLVMEYVEGLTFRRVITLCQQHGATIPQEVIAEMGRQTCDGLHYAHEAKSEAGVALRLIHRDIKPSNLMLNTQSTVKVLDFGVSRGDIGNAVEERKGSVKGTWGYMAPEQARGDDVTPATDVFGLATVLYEMASLRSLFRGKQPDEIKRLLADDHAARMAALLDPAYSALIPVLVRALQRDPKARYATAADFGRALSSLLPDPITARDGVNRFSKMIDELREGKSVATSPGAVERKIGSSAGFSLAAPQAGEKSSSNLWIVLGVSVGALVLVVLVVAAVLVSAALPLGDTAQVPESPPPTAKEPVAPPPPEPLVSRPPPAPPPEVLPAVAAPARTPAVQAPPPKPKPVPVVVRVVEVPTEEPEEIAALVEAPPAPPPAAPQIGYLTISATQPAEVFVDGKFIRATPVVKMEFEAGHHIVTIVAKDGRRKSVDLELPPGEQVSRVWDFDRGEWKR